MNEKCIICESGHGEWVDSQHKAGLSTRQIAAELKEKFGLSVSHVTVASHLNHGDKSDRMAVLEARIRNLEVWMSSALGPETFLTWLPKLAKPGEVHHHTLSHHHSYMQTIPNPETIQAESIAILRTISEGMDEEEAERDARQKEIWMKEKAERDIRAKVLSDEQEAARKKASEEAKRVEIEEMRKSVKEYDSRPKSI
jgi:hypothetical protein